MVGWKRIISGNLLYTILISLFAFLSVFLSFQNTKKEKIISELKQENYKLKNELKKCIDVSKKQSLYYSKENDKCKYLFFKNIEFDTEMKNEINNFLNSVKEK